MTKFVCLFVYYLFDSYLAHLASRLHWVASFNAINFAVSVVCSLSDIPVSVLATVAYALVTACLNYCNILYMGLPLKMI